VIGEDLLAVSDEFLVITMAVENRND